MSLLLGSTQRWQQHRSQDRDDRDDHEQFNKCEGFIPGRTANALFHSFLARWAGCDLQKNNAEVRATSKNLAGGEHCSAPPVICESFICQGERRVKRIRVNIWSNRGRTRKERTRRARGLAIDQVALDRVGTTA